MTSETIFDVEYLFNTTGEQEEPELAVGLTREELIEMHLDERRSHQKPIIPEGLPAGLLFRGYAFRYVGIPAGSKKAYYTCLGTNCKDRCPANLGLLFTSVENATRNEKGRELYEVETNKPHNKKMVEIEPNVMEIDDQPCSSRTRRK